MGKVVVAQIFLSLLDLDWGWDFGLGLGLGLVNIGNLGFWTFFLNSSMDSLKVSLIMILNPSLEDGIIQKRREK